MIRSMLTLTAGLLFCLLVAGCSGNSHPEDAAHDKGPRPPPSTPQQAPDAGAGMDKAQSGGPPPPAKKPAGG